MKIKTKLLTILAPAALISTVAPIALTSCGNNEVDLTINTTKGDHVTSISYEGELKTNKEFKIICSFERGWAKINKTKTTIKVGSTTLTEGQDKDYDITTDNTITVHKNVIKNKDVTVHVEAEATAKSMTYTIEKGSSTFYCNDTIVYAKPNDKLTKDNIKVQLIKGDSSKETINIGKGNNECAILKDGQDITESFATNGYTFQTSETAGGPKQLYFQLKYTHGNVSIKNTLMVFCGKQTTTLALKNITDLKVGGEGKMLQCTAGTDEWYMATYEIVASGTTATDAKIDKSGMYPLLVPGTIAGDVVIKATAVIGTATDTKTFTIASA